MKTGWRAGRTFWNVSTSSELEALLVAEDSWRVQSSFLKGKAFYETAFCKVIFWELRGL